MSRLRTIWSWARWPLAVGIIVLLFYSQREGFQDFARQEKQWPYLLVALLFSATGMALTFVRWHWLVRALGFDFRLSEAFRLGLMGTAFGYIGPGLIGGDAFKAVAIASGHPGRRIVAAGTVFLDRVLGLLALLWVGALGAWLSRTTYQGDLHATVRAIFWSSSLIGTIGLFAMLFPIVTHSRWISWVARLPVAGKIFQQVMDGLSLYQQRPLVLVGATVMAVLGHMLMIGGLYFCALGLGGWAPGLTAHFYFTPAAEIIGLIPTPSGIGPQEFAITEGYGAVAGQDISRDAARQAGLFAGIAFRLIHLMIAAVGAIFYFVSGPKRAVPDATSATTETTPQPAG